MKQTHVNVPTVLVVAGPTGVGKTSALLAIQEHIESQTLSMGNWLRQKAQEDTALAAIMSRRDLVPDTYMIPAIEELVTAYFNSFVESKKALILEGLPRTSYQARKILALLDAHGLGEGKMVCKAVELYVKPPLYETVIHPRIRGRRVDPTTGKIYNIETGVIPDDTAVLQRLTQRDDDRGEHAFKGLKIYKEQVASVLTGWGALGCTVHRIDATKNIGSVQLTLVAKLLE